MDATINSIGIYVPEREVDNHYFESIIETNDEWIQSRTGIRKRYFSAADEFTSDLSVRAAQNLSKDFNKNLSEVDFVIVATSTPDQVMPSVASQVQARLEIPNAGCIDIYAACAGFVYGITLAKGLIAAGTHKKILVIGAETLSKSTDFTDRTSCIIFGDGAGAVIVETSEENYIFNAATTTDGKYGKDLYIAHQAAPINGQQIEPNGLIHQNGKVVFKWAVSSLIKKIRELAEINDVALDKLDWMIPHSANMRILEAVCDGLDFPVEKCLESIRDYGNTSSASIPIAWYNGLKDGRIKLGDKILLAGFGGGLTYSGIYIHNQINFNS